jgi:hypothetical protein
MDNNTFFILLITLLFLATAILNMYLLKKERDELRYKYDYLVTILLTEILKRMNTSNESSSMDSEGETKNNQ